MTLNIDTLLSSALPDVIRCVRHPECGWKASSLGRHADTDDGTVLLLRDRGWQVVDGAWTCPDHLPVDRRDLPGAMGRRPNPHCATCGDDRGGAYGHEAHECN